MNSVEKLPHLLYFRLPQIYEELHHTISNADDEKDLRWWSNNHGINMAMQWPQFEVSASDKEEIYHIFLVLLTGEMMTIIDSLTRGDLCCLYDFLYLKMVKSFLTFIEDKIFWYSFSLLD